MAAVADSATTTELGWRTRLRVGGLAVFHVSTCLVTRGYASSPWVQAVRELDS